MAEYAYIPVQTVQPGQNVLLNTEIPCNRGYVYHREQSGIVTLRGIVNNPNACFARYRVEYGANIALATGATVGPISVALAISGETVEATKAIVTPAAVGDYFSVSRSVEITVPRGCCFNVALENSSEPAAAGAARPAAPHR